MLADASNDAPRVPLASRDLQLANARYAKLRKAKRKVKIPKHLVTRINRANSKAFRPKEVIDPHEQKPQKLKKDQYRKWLPQGVLKACFTPYRKLQSSPSRGAMRMRRLRGPKKRIGKRRAPPQPLCRPTACIAEEAARSLKYS